MYCQLYDCPLLSGCRSRLGFPKDCLTAPSEHVRGFARPTPARAGHLKAAGLLRTGKRSDHRLPCAFCRQVALAARADVPGTVPQDDPSLLAAAVGAKTAQTRALLARLAEGISSSSLADAERNAQPLNVAGQP